MFPITFQKENVANMNADTVSLVCNFIARNMQREVPDDYVFKHHYCLMIHTGSSLCLSGLVLVRLIPEHVGRTVHELNSLCVEHEFRNGGLGSELLRHVRENLQDHDFLRLYVDAGPDHDRLVQFYHRNGLKTLYSNALETCLQSHIHADWCSWRRVGVLVVVAMLAGLLWSQIFPFNVVVPS